MNRKIKHLTQREHILLRPNMYVGSCETSDVSNFLILKRNSSKKSIDITYNKKFKYNEGFYRLFIEALDNAVDEVIRCNSEGYYPPFIRVEVNTKDNSLVLTDTGKGFKTPEHINKETGLSDVELAFTKMQAGSNFDNDNLDISIVGTNGIGISAVCMLSDYFSVRTINKTTNYFQDWNEFKCSNKEISKTLPSDNIGTSIKFIPLKSLFGNMKWNFDILFTKLYFKHLEFSLDENLKKTKIEFIFDGKIIDLHSYKLFSDRNSIKVQLNKNCNIFLWETNGDLNNTNISFVNGSLCTGNHQKYIQDFINSRIFSDKNAHKFYNMFINIKLKPKYVKFREQVKERLSIDSEILEKQLPLRISNVTLTDLQSSTIFKNIQTSINEYNDLLNNKKVNRLKNKSKNTITSNFYNSKNKKNLFICEGQSALGSILSARNAKNDAMYALRGKIANVTPESELLENKVLSDLVAILELLFSDYGKSCKYEKIIIATDADTDGDNISFLLINFFNTFFKSIIEDGKLYRLKVPLVSYTEDGKIVYVYNNNEIQNEDLSKKTKVRYLKGLGSLNETDWSTIFSDMNLEQYKKDKTCEKMIGLFSDKKLIQKRKNYLTQSLK